MSTPSDMRPTATGQIRHAHPKHSNRKDTFATGAKTADWLKIGTVEEIAENGPKVVKGIAVFAHDGDIYAVENRCPHMGFPLHLGSICDGLLTCHWHHARFDVCSGGTLDPWADDVPAHSVVVEGDVVYVNPRPKEAKDSAWYQKRLREGLEQNLSLIIAKAVVALVRAGVPAAKIAQVGVEFGTRERSAGWGPGLTILTANLNVISKLDTYGQILALVQGLVHVARDSAGRPTRHMLQELPHTEFGLDRLSQWYRQSVEVRDTDGAERVLLTAQRAGANDDELADMMLVAVTDHFYQDGGHTLDFHNKAFEAAQQVEGHLKAQILTSLVPLLANPTRSEELQNWQAPVDLVHPLVDAFRELELETDAAQTIRASDTLSPAASGKDLFECDDEHFVSTVLADDPLATVRFLTDALKAGVPARHLASLTALAAAKRIVHFHTQNDFGDWIAVLHTFSHAHAIHERLKVSTSPLLIRGIYHTAMRIYLDRFLNIPSAALPKPGAGDRAGYTTDLAELLQLTDRQQQVAQAATWVSHYLDEKAPIAPLWNTLGDMLLREDAEFHSFQLFEAVVKEYDTWEQSLRKVKGDAQRTLVVAATRYLAAHAPTARELPQVARIAWRLSRGEKLFEEAGD